MAAIVIPNQPFKLIENGETLNERNARQMWDRRQFCQLVKTSQTQQFQLRVTEDSGNNIVANGNFLQGENSWTDVANNITVITNPQTGHAAYYNPDGMLIIGTLTQPLTLESKTYKLTFDIVFNPSGVNGTFDQALRAAITNATQIGGDAPQTNSNTNEVVSRVMYFRVDATPNVLGFDFLTDNITPVNHGIRNIVLLELTEPVLSLQDCNGNYIKDVNIVERFEDRVTYTHSWADMTDGQCYQFCLLGGDDLAANHVEGSFCLTDERGRVLLDEFGNCIQFEIT